MALQTKVISANGSKGHHKFALTVHEDSTNRDSNTSAISWLFQIDPIVAGYDWVYSGAVSYTITINGTNYTGTIDSYDGSSTVVIRSGSNTITHNSDGTKSISYSFSVSSYNVSYLPGSAGASGTMTLTNIARSASITSVPASFNDETTSITIGYTNPLGNSATTVKTCITLQDGTTMLCNYRDVSKTGTSYTYTFTDAEKTKFRNNITSGYSVSVRIYITTIADGKTYYSSKNVMLSLVNASPQMAAPIVKDTNAATIAVKGTASGTFIADVSNLYYEFSATGRKGATITKYEVVCGNYKSSSRTGTINGLRISPLAEQSIKCIATDSRGNTITSTYPLTQVDYAKPQANVWEAPKTSSGNLIITVEGFYTEGYLDGTSNGANGGKLNTAEVQYRYKEDKSGTTYTAWTTDTAAVYKKDSTTGKMTWEIHISGLEYTSTYKLQVRIKDLIGAGDASPEYTMRMIPVFDWSRDDFAINVPTRITSGEVYMTDKSGIETLTMAYEELDSNTTDLNIGILTYSGSQEYNVNINSNDNITLNPVNGAVWCNGPLWVEGYNLNDFVHTSGTASMGSNGTWYWRKWNSGMAECWGVRNYGNMAVSTAWGSLYESSVFNQALPSGLFNAAPSVVNINIVSSQGAAWIVQGYGSNSATQTGNFSVVRPVSGNLSQVYIGFHAIGRWK